jgi:NitT/TauT family transport system substrate-binding protein
MCFIHECAQLPELRGRGVSRRRILSGAGAAALTIAVGPFIGAAHAAGSATIRSSHGTGFCNLNFFLTTALQLGQQDGVTLDMLVTPTAADQITLLGAGQADAGLIPYTNFIALRQAGVPLKIVAGGGIEGCILVAQPGLDSLEKLKGKTLGTYQLNTLEILPYDWLKKRGVKFSDINVRYMGSIPEGAEAFRAGAIDLLSTVEPYGTALVNDVKGAVMLSDGTDVYGKGYTDCVFAVREDVIEGNAKAVKGIIKAMMQAQLMAETEPQEVLNKLVGAYYKTSMENAKIAMAKQPSVVDARNQTQFILERVDSLMEMGYIKKKPDASAIDWTLLEQVIAENKDLWNKLKYKSA